MRRGLETNSPQTTQRQKQSIKNMVKHHRQTSLLTLLIASLLSLVTLEPKCAREVSS